MLNFHDFCRNNCIENDFILELERFGQKFEILKQKIKKLIKWSYEARNAWRRTASCATSRRGTCRLPWWNWLDFTRFQPGYFYSGSINQFTIWFESIIVPQFSIIISFSILKSCRKPQFSFHKYSSKFIIETLFRDSMNCKILFWIFKFCVGKKFSSGSRNPFEINTFRQSETRLKFRLAK